MTKVILVRHGQTEWNRVERFRGRFDVPLNATGLIQAEAAGKRIAASWQPAAIYTSPLGRAFQTAEKIALPLHLPVNFHSGLIDIDYGEWQGLHVEVAQKRYPDMMNAWYQSPHQAVIPAGESLADVRARAIAAVEELERQYDGQTIVLVSHTVVNRIILLGILGLGNERFWHLRQEPCAINVIEAGGGDYTLVTMNDTCHLKTMKSA